MRIFRAGGLCVALGWAAVGAWGDEATLDRTLPPAVVRSAAPINGGPLVSLGRPHGVSLGAPVGARPAPADGTIAPASFQTAQQPIIGETRNNDESARRRASAPTLWADASSLNDALIPTGFASESPVIVSTPEAGVGFAPDTGVWGGSDIALPPVDGPAPSLGFFVRPEYLIWGIKDSKVPVLVTTGPPESSGILGAPGTEVLFGGGSVDNDTRSGGRLTGGFPLRRLGQTSLETTFFFLNERTVRFGADSSQFPVLARPFFNLNEGIEFSEITASPGIARGRIDVSSSSRLWGGEINLRRPLWNGPAWTVDWLIGFRYLELNEELEMLENVNVLVGEFAGSQSSVFDSFATRNRFYGGQLGLVGRWGTGRWNVDLWGKLGMGNNAQVLNVVGNQVVTSPTGEVSNFTGGLLALNSNIGHYTRDEFAVVPELGVNVSYQVGCHWRLFVGYNFLYWSNVLRPGDQIDRVLDVTRIPNFSTGSVPAPQVRPIVPFTDSDFWAQGANFGVEWKW